MKRFYTPNAGRQAQHAKTLAQNSDIQIKLRIVWAVFWIFLFLPVASFGQNEVQIEGIYPDRLLDSVWNHPESFINRNDANWLTFSKKLSNLDILQQNQLVHELFYGKNSYLLNRSHANNGFIGDLNNFAQNKKQRKFYNKIENGFRNYSKNPEHKIVLVEGDSWFEFPIFLRDITDHLEKEPDMAIYTVAHGSDWLSNMVISMQYEYEYFKIKPDVLLISGGGNDLVSGQRLSNFIRLKPLQPDSVVMNNYRNYVMLRLHGHDASVCNLEACQLQLQELSHTNGSLFSNVDTALVNQIVLGKSYLNQNYYRMLATLKLEYKLLFESMRKLDPERFSSLKIITQGYDYAIPSSKMGFGIHIFIENGIYLKQPLLLNGITSPYIQQSIMKTMIFEVNEMLIELGKEYNNVYHVDSRGITAYIEKINHKKPGKYWYDEIHPKSKIFNIIASVYSDIIFDKTLPNERVISVIEASQSKLNHKK